MNISNSITAPILLIVILVMLILFKGAFLKNAEVVVEPPNNIASNQNQDGSGDDVISYNGVKYYPDRIVLLMIIAYVCSFLLPMVFYVKLKGMDWFGGLKLALPNMRMIPFSIYMFFILAIGTVFIDYLFFSLSGETLAFPTINTGGNIVFNIGVFLAFIFVPAACEEFVFRAVLIAEYEKYGLLLSLLATSIAFAMSKLSLQLFCVYFYASIIFFICVKLTNSILIPVILHTGYNFFNIYMENEIMGVLKSEQNRFVLLFVLSILFMIFISLSLSAAEYYYYRKVYANDPLPVNIPKSQGIIANFAKIFLSPSFIITVIIFFIYISVTV